MMNWVESWNQGMRTASSHMRSLKGIACVLQLSIAQKSLVLCEWF